METLRGTPRTISHLTGKASTQPGNPSSQARPATLFGFTQRKTAARERYDVVKCDGCQGKGVVRFGTRPVEYCMKCAGAGELIVKEKQGRPLVEALADYLLFLGVAMGVTTVALLILLWRAHAL